jgi:hypothetical protein
LRCHLLLIEARLIDGVNRKGRELAVNEDWKPAHRSLARLSIVLRASNEPERKFEYSDRAPRFRLTPVSRHFRTGVRRGNQH